MSTRTRTKTMRMTLGAASALLLVATLASAQNGTNYHVLNNGFDIAYAGIGAGGSQTDQDGIGRWIPGELINGGTLGAGGLPTYKQVAWRESVCIFGPGPGTLAIRFPLIALTELNATPFPTIYSPIVFTPVVDPLNVIFPLGNSAGFVPFGIPAGSSASFVLAGLPSGCGSGLILLPNEDIAPSANGGFATLLACATGTSLPIASTGFCWSVQFTWIPSALNSLAWPTGGWWHYLRNSQDNNQYWAMSNDELNTWQTRSVSSDAGLTAITAFTANVEYSLISATRDPYTNVALQPVGINGAGPWYFQTENFTTAFVTPALNLNGGIDMGGHQSLSLGGTGGVPNPATGLGNQDPLGVGGGALPTLGVWTFDNGSPAADSAGSTGSKRVTWITWNTDATFGVDPNLTEWIFLFGGTVKVPSPNPSTFAQWLQPVTLALLPQFTHEVDSCPSGCPDPGGFASGAFGIPAIQGGSDQLPLLGVGPLTAGLEICIVVGTSCLRGEPGEPAGGFCWNPEGWSPSGETTIYITD